MTSIAKLKPKQSWRDVIAIHPAAQLFPSMHGEDLRKLGADIKQNGLRSPIVLWAEGDQINHAPYQLLDGRNRLDAMELVGLKTCTDGSLSNTLAEYSHVTGHQSNVILHLHEFSIDVGGQRYLAVDPYAYSISTNLQRRHLTKEQQAALIIAAEKARAENDRFISNRSFNPERGKKGGSTKNPIKEAVEKIGDKLGISKGTIKRAWDKSNRSEPITKQHKELSATSPKGARVRHITKEMKRLDVTKQDIPEKLPR